MGFNYFHLGSEKVGVYTLVIFPKFMLVNEINGWTDELNESMITKLNNLGM